MNELAKKWFEGLIRIWQEQKPEEITEIVSDNFEWHETPFDEAIKSKDELLKEWQCILSQKDISINYDIVAIQNNVAIAHWNGKFTRDTGKKAEMDGIWKVALNDDGKCTEFRQWYQLKS